MSLPELEPGDKKSRESDSSFVETTDETSLVQPIPRIYQNQNGIFRCDQCGEFFPNHILLAKHIKAHKDRPYQCLEPGCDKRFFEKGHLVAHLRIHASDRSFACAAPGCGKRFHAKGHLVTHMRLHTGERPFACDIPGCPKRFTEKGPLISHKRTHTGERPFACEIPNCTKRFTQQGQLMNHLRSHKGERPYICHHCNKRFIQKGHLKTHYKNVHPEEDAPNPFRRPFPCTYPGCNKRYRKQINLLSHAALHKSSVHNDEEVNIQSTNNYYSPTLANLATSLPPNHNIPFLAEAVRY